MPSSMTSAQFRQSYFPGLKNTHWLASCSLTTPSSFLTEKMQEMLEVMSKPHLAWNFFEEQVESVRHKIARLIHSEPEQIALLPNASVCAFQIVSTITGSPAVRLAYCDKEFPSIANVWHAQTISGAQILHGDENQLADILCNGEALDLLSIPLVGYMHGDRLPVEELIEKCSHTRTRVVVDAYQGLGVIPVNVQTLRCDFLFGGTMKYLCGLPGLAFLYVRDPESIGRAPQLTGWFARRDPFDFLPHSLDFATDARRFETGTLSIPAIFAAEAGLTLLEQTDPLAVKQHIASLIEYAALRLRQQEEQLCGYSGSQTHGAHLAIHVKDPYRLATFLEHYAIVTSPRGQVLRLSFHYFNSKEDIDVVCLRLQQYRRSNK